MKLYLVPIEPTREPTTQSIAEALAEMQLLPGESIHVLHNSEFGALHSVDWQLVLPDEEEASLSDAEYEAYFRHHAPICLQLVDLFQSHDPGDYRLSEVQLERIRFRAANHYPLPTVKIAMGETVSFLPTLTRPLYLLECSN